MSGLALLLDEDVRVLLAETLRQRGYDAVHVLETERGGKSDPDQLKYAVSQSRSLLTHNIRDYLILHQTYQAHQIEHCGIIVSDQVPFRDLLRRTLRCFSQIDKEDAYNKVVWLRGFK